MKKSIRSVLFTGAVAACLLGAASAAQAQDIKERNIKFAFVNTADSAHGLGAKRFAEVVASKSNNKLTIKLYPGGTLGGEAVMASAMQGGTVEMSMMGPGLLTGMDKEFGVFDTPFPELYGALEAKAVEGQENPFISVEVTKFYEVQKYASTTRHAYSPLLVLASKKFWDQLSADERKLLTDAAEEVKSYEQQVSRELDAKAIDTLKVKGMSITEISSAESARMREKLKPVIDKHRAASGDLGREMTAEVERIRAGK